MGNIFKTEKRRVIPKWRSVNVTQGTGELKLTAKENRPFDFTNQMLNDQIKSFKENRTLENAGDLLSSAYSLGLEKDFNYVAEFILNKADNPNDALTSLAEEILQVKKDYNSQQGSEKQYLKNIYNNFEIRKYRSYLKIEPHNPIAWVELARLYLAIGKSERSKKCIDTALSLDSDNRFIVRSASRFYHHHDSNSERALAIIKKSNFINNDPWIISAEIAYSSILERHSKLAKQGIQFIKNKKYTNADITELASSIGTLEFDNGNIKSAKRYFEQSLICPNDNTVSQATWMTDEIPSLNIKIHPYKTPFVFEAETKIALEQENYINAFDHAIKWAEDEPFSTRPAKISSYIKSIYLNNNNAAIEILKENLKLNPKDLMLNNNLVYFLMRENKVVEALNIFNSKLKNRIKDIDNAAKLTLTATAGLVAYRENLREEGKTLYESAIKIARNIQNEYLVALATVNYAKEEARFIQEADSLTPQIQFLKNYLKKNKSPDIKIFFDELETAIEKISHEVL